MDDAQLLSIVSIIASNHGCTITSVDMDLRTVNIDGPVECQIACAMAIGEMLEAYAV